MTMLDVCCSKYLSKKLLFSNYFNKNVTSKAAVLKILSGKPIIDSSICCQYRYQGLRHHGYNSVHVSALTFLDNKLAVSFSNVCGQATNFIYCELV